MAIVTLERVHLRNVGLDLGTMKRSRKDLAEVKIFGERNTGTNALKALIEGNSSTEVSPSVAKEIDPNFELTVRVLRVTPKRYRARLMERYIDFLFGKATPRTAWKHTATNFDEVHSFDGCPVIFTTRHPASWLLGLYHRPYHALARFEGDFAAFLCTPWILVKRDNLNRRAMLPGELLNAKARSHLSLIEKLSKRNMPLRTVKFEDFVVNQEAVFLALKGILTNPVEAPTIIQKSTKDKGKDYRYYQDYYGEERWKDEITPESADLIERSVDWSLARDLGYTRL